MKTMLYMLVIFASVITGCTGNAGDHAQNISTEDSVRAGITDLSLVTNIKTLLCQDWEDKSDAEDAAASGSGGNIEMPYRGFSFFADSTLVQNPRDNIRFGKWIFDDSTKLVDIVYADGKKARFKIAAIGPKKMILQNTSDKKMTEYIADAKTETIPVNDPFHFSHNQWRVKPAHAETDSALKNRVKQCVLFYAAFLKDNADRGGNIISFVGLPTCFKWYRGGISVVNKNKLETKWADCFYNKEQSVKGQQMIENIIGKKYKWNKQETNWVKQSADVLLQMYDTLR